MDCFRKLSLLIASLVMAGVFTVACDSGTQEPEAPDTSTPLESGEATDAPSASNSPPTELPEGVTAAIPEEFPNDIPIYPGSVPAQGKGAVSEGVPMAALQLQSSDEPEEVYDFYVDKLRSEGWSIKTREGPEGSNTISATKGECTAIVLAAPNDDGGTGIFVLTQCPDVS
jgi:hypothetical protein